MIHDGDISIGVLAKTYGTDGTVICKFDPKYYEKIEKMEYVFLEIDKKHVPFFISSLTIRNYQSALIRFKDYESEETIKPFLGCSVFLPQSTENEEEDEFREVINFSVISKVHGKIGSVQDILRSEHNITLQVLSQDNKEYLIPAHHDIITEIDRDQSIIYINPPEGLLEINT